MNIPGYACNIGLEIHIQLNTKTKAFCRDINKFGSEPNTSISEISLGYPGTLPMVNRNHIISAIKLGHALKSTISELQYFDRKNYHYPDLPKGYQITQDAIPICIGGIFEFISDGNLQTINIHHVHCEEDAGKNIHDISKENSLLDYNRAGTPLLEMVTEPDFTSAKQVHDFLAELQRLVRYINISDANMEEGSLRCDCNVSIRPIDSVTLGTRVEIKNLNSKKFAQLAIVHEAERQFKLIKEGKNFKQQTRLYNSQKNMTFPMRDKEEVNDYRYFPDPDIQPLIIDRDLIENIKSDVIHTPNNARIKLKEEFKLSDETIEQLVDDKSNYLYFLYLDETLQNANRSSNFTINTVLPYLSKSGIIAEQFPLKPTIIKEIFESVDRKQISLSSAKQKLIPFLLETPEINVATAINKLDISINSDNNIVEEIVNKVLLENSAKVKEYQSGKKGLIGFFMGQAMKSGGNKILPDDLKKAFEKALN